MWRAAILTIFLLIAGSASAGRIGELEVRQGAGGQPCFSISQAEEQRGGTPDFDSITVSDGKTVAWTMSMPRQRTFPVTVRMCIPYAGRLPVLPQTPAADLRPGRPYDVLITTRKPGAAPQGYRARFCLTRDAAGQLALQVSKSTAFSSSTHRADSACAGR